MMKTQMSRQSKRHSGIFFCFCSVFGAQNNEQRISLFNLRKKRERERGKIRKKVVVVLEKFLFSQFVAIGRGLLVFRVSVVANNNLGNQRAWNNSKKHGIATKQFNLQNLPKTEEIVWRCNLIYRFISWSTCARDDQSEEAAKWKRSIFSMYERGNHCSTCLSNKFITSLSTIKITTTLQFLKKCNIVSQDQKIMLAGTQAL